MTLLPTTETSVRCYLGQVTPDDSGMRPPGGSGLLVWQLEI